MIAALLGVASIDVRPAYAEQVVLWHSYRGAEQEALEASIELLRQRRPDLDIEVLALPHDSYASKLTTAIPRDNGPDVFIFAHERIGGWADAQIIEPLDPHLRPGELDAFLPATVEPLRYGGKVWALPLAYKTLALFRNPALLERAPPTIEALIAEAERLRGDNVYGLAYLHELFYFHATWLGGFGAPIWTEDGEPGFATEGSLEALRFVDDLVDRGLMPEEPTGALIARLFAGGEAAAVISGPWFLGELPEGTRFEVSPLPPMTVGGRSPRPFLSDEAAFIARGAGSPESALAVARFLAGPESAVLRAKIGRQVVANVDAWRDPEIAGDPLLATFRAAAETALPMESAPRMRTIWEPGDLMLKKAFRRGDTPAEAARAGLRRWRATTKPPPPTRSFTPYLIAGIVLFLLIAGAVIRWLLSLRRRGQLGEAARSWVWLSPALIATGVLLFLPFLVGCALSLFAHRSGDWSFVGLGNFADILFGSTYSPVEPLSFYFALAVTVLWTAVNLFLHVALGLALALILARPALRLRPVYRVLLIVPWAVPNYITALLWKGMFHKQHGAINSIFEAFGLEPVSWFSSFWTSFFANVCANAWLGFPFMMVICLGALASVPRDLVEAAEIDGANRWQIFRHVKLPLLWPALVPALLIGTVWTFNQFNIVYLVSGGEPDNSTDILISEAYRWAFTRQEAYGYAAAYAVLIFAILLVWSVASARMARRAEEM
jgi:arabinogalactan oligomer/maltooligosaccharide transport system permease protein